MNVWRLKGKKITGTAACCVDVYNEAERHMAAFLKTRHNKVSYVFVNFAAHFEISWIVCAPTGSPPQTPGH